MDYLKLLSLLQRGTKSLIVILDVTTYYNVHSYHKTPTPACIITPGSKQLPESLVNGSPFYPNMWGKMDYCGPYCLYRETNYESLITVLATLTV